MQKARKSFAAYLSNVSQTGGSNFEAAALAVAYVEAEMLRSGLSHLALALHVLAWLGGPPSKFQALVEKGAQMPSEARSIYSLRTHIEASLTSCFSEYDKRDG
jgi:hypothetical protein